MLGDPPIARGNLNVRATRKFEGKPTAVTLGNADLSRFDFKPGRQVHIRRVDSGEQLRELVVRDRLLEYVQALPVRRGRKRRKTLCRYRPKRGPINCPKNEKQKRAWHRSVASAPLRSNINRCKEGQVGMFRLLFLGDIIGGPGRKAVIDSEPRLKQEWGIAFVVLNRANAAAGRGITHRSTTHLLRDRIAVITTGDHGLDQKD